MLRNYFLSALISLLIVMLTGCAKRPVVQYNPDDFVNPNRVVIKTVPVHIPPTKVNATFGYGNNPEVIQAYKEFSKNGKAKSIHSEGFITLPYDGYSHPIIACEPLHLCVVQLERGEKINNIDLGDSAHWLVNTALVGTQQDGSYQIAIKPKAYNIATDMVITTNKRTYNIGLVSKKGQNTHVATFYYPEESLDQAIQAVHAQEVSPQQRRVIDSSSHVDIDHIHFNYRLRGDYPAWRPLQVFDDGNKTYIRMPAIAAHVDLPVLYILRRSTMQLVNYRYKRPYYIVDALFKRAVLVSGRGHHQVKVVIDNRHFS